jgi:two-component system NtrC family response regulator
MSKIKLKKKKPAAKGKALKPKVRRARLLVVDDEADFVKLIQAILAKEGYWVDTATSAAEAIALQRKNTYDVALVDLRMPEMTGLELLQYLKTHDKSIFVILMTAYGSFSVGIEALRQGACDYVSKPFKNKVLKEKVSEAIDRRTHYLEEQQTIRHSSVDEL